MRSAIKHYQRGGIWLSAALLLLLLVAATGMTLTMTLTGTTEQLLWRQQFLAVQAKRDVAINNVITQMYLPEKWPANLPPAITKHVSHVQETRFYDANILSSHLSVQRSAGPFTQSREMDIVRFPLLMNVPAAPLVVFSHLHHQSGFTLYLPPSKQNPAYRYSLWSSAPVLSAPNRLTCETEVINLVHCKASALSSDIHRASDIIENDTQLNIPIAHYLFASDLDGSSTDDYQKLAWVKATSCDSLPWPASFIWITGHCRIRAKQMVGSRAAPVLLVVENGHLELEDQASIFGMVVSLRVNNQFSWKVKMAENTKIIGSLLINHPTSSDSHFNVVYDHALLRQLQRSPALQQLAVIPGTEKPGTVK